MNYIGMNLRIEEHNFLTTMRKRFLGFLTIAQAMLYAASAFRCAQANLKPSALT